MKKVKKLGFITIGIAVVSICSIISISVVHSYTLAPIEETKQDIKSSVSTAVLQKMKQVSAKTLSSQNKDDYLVFYYSDDCIISKNFVSSVEEYSSRENALPIYAINVQAAENEKIVEEEHIIGTPTIVHIKDGAEVWRTIGALELNQFPTIL